MSYLDVGALIYSKLGRDYQTFGDTNQDLYTYKTYPKQLVTNGHNLLELKFNISDAVLLGSGDSIESMTEVVSKY